MNPAELTLVLLAGGGGTRIRHLHPHLPKPLIPVAGRPFLEWVCRWWIRQGVRRMVVGLGHLAETAMRHIDGMNLEGVELAAVCEPRPLGTGGGALFVARAVELSDPCIIANADSLAFGDLAPVFEMLDEATLDGVVLAVAMEDASRYGTLRVDRAGLLEGFEEKRPGRGVINAGVYLLRRRLLDRFPAREPLSMEYHVFPALVAAGARLRVHTLEGPFLDIGTPESLAQAGSFIEKHMALL